MSTSAETAAASRAATPKMTLGIRLPNSGPFARADTIITAAQLADRLRFDTVWVHDHVSWPRDQRTPFAAGRVEAWHGQDTNFFESVTTAALLGGHLRHARMGIAGLPMPLRDPRVLAKQFATIDQLAATPLVVAVGIGGLESDFAVMGVPFKRRGKITDDHLGALRAIVDSDQPMSYHGEQVSFSDATFLPRPSRLSIWATGSSAPAVRRAARHGDGWMTTYVTPEEYRTTAHDITHILTDRAPSRSFEYGYETFICIAEKRSEAIEISSASLSEQFGSTDKGHAVCFIGDPDDVCTQLRRYHHAGATHIELKYICRDPQHLYDMVTLTAEQVMPRL